MESYKDKSKMNLNKDESRQSDFLKKPTHAGLIESNPGNSVKDLKDIIQKKNLVYSSPLIHEDKKHDSCRILQSKFAKFKRRPNFDSNKIEVMDVRVHCFYPQRGQGFFHNMKLDVQIMFHICDIKNFTTILHFMESLSIEFKVMTQKENNDKFKVFMIDKTFFFNLKSIFKKIISNNNNSNLQVKY